MDEENSELMEQAILTLTNVFGHGAFKSPLQKQAVEAILSGLFLDGQQLLTELRGMLLNVELSPSLWISFMLRIGVALVSLSDKIHRVLYSTGVQVWCFIQRYVGYQQQKSLSCSFSFFLCGWIKKTEIETRELQQVKTN